MQFMKYDNKRPNPASRKSHVEMPMNDLLACTQPTRFIDSDHPAINAFAAQHIAATDRKEEAAVKLYYAVRDGFKYDPYRIEADPDTFKASVVLSQGYGMCITKAVLLAACARSVNIPAKLGFANVRNHLSTERMRQALQTDIFYWHGYTLLYLRDRWVKATPAFNIELCEKFSLKPLEFDGKNDSIYHPFDLHGNKHMEYVHSHGEFTDLPFRSMLADFMRYYPQYHQKVSQADFNADVAKEAR
jgi:transglutaminase-like putative cysteine protease